jgi:hypothetical protein
VLRSQCLSDVLPFLVTEHDATIVAVHREVVVEQTCVLLHDVYWSAEGGPGLSIQAVAMSGGDHVGSHLVEGVVDHISGLVDGQLGAVLRHIAVGADEDQIGGLAQISHYVLTTAIP